MPGWAVALTVIAAIALLITLLLLLRLRITIRYRGELTVFLRVLFYRRQLYPKKEKPLRPSDFSARRLRCKKKKEERKAARRARKNEKRSGTGGEKKEKGVAFSDLPTLLEALRHIVGKLIVTFLGHLRVEVTRICIVVATDDAAKTAVTYGAVSQGLSALLALLESVTDVRYPGKYDVNVVPDFLADRFSADLELTFSLRLAHLLDILIRTAYNYLKGKQTPDAENESIHHTDRIKGKDQKNA